MRVDYSNPQVVKQVMEEAKDKGIFATGKDYQCVWHTFVLKLDVDNAMTLDMIKKEQRKYKLKQVDFIGGLSSLYKEKTKLLSIEELPKTFFNYNYKIKILLLTDKSGRAWDSVKLPPNRLIFESKDNFIEIINIKKATFKIRKR